MFESVMGTQTSIWDDFQRLQRELDSLFGAGLGRSSIRSVAGGTFPAVNVGTTEDAVRVYVFAPGLTEDDLDVSIQQSVLTVSGNRETGRSGNNGDQPTSSGDGQQYHLRERFGGSFRRVIGLPEDIDPESVDANYRNGVLMINIAKKETAKPHKVQIQS